MIFLYTISDQMIIIFNNRYFQAAQIMEIPQQAQQRKRRRRRGSKRKSLTEGHKFRNQDITSFDIKQRLGYNPVPDIQKDVCVMSISQEEFGQIIYEIRQRFVKKLVNRKYLTERNYLEELCQFYESHINLYYMDEVYVQPKKELEHQQQHYNLGQIIPLKRCFNSEKLHKMILITKEDLQNNAKMLYRDHLSYRGCSRQEDEYLLEARKKMISFEDIARNLKRETPEFWYHRYQFIAGNEKIIKLTKNQEIYLHRCVSKNKYNWRFISKQFNKQFKYQLKLYLGPQALSRYYHRDIRKMPIWTLETDLRFLELLSEYGTQYQKIKNIMNIDSTLLVRRFNFLYNYFYVQQKKE